ERLEYAVVTLKHRIIVVMRCKLKLQLLHNVFGERNLWQPGAVSKRNSKDRTILPHASSSVTARFGGGTSRSRKSSANGRYMRWKPAGRSCRPSAVRSSRCGNSATSRLAALRVGTKLQIATRCDSASASSNATKVVVEP